MRFELTDDEIMLRDMARDFVARTVGDGAGAWDHARAIPPRVLAALDELGLGGLCAPESAGGAGLGLMALAVVVEALAVGSASLAALTAAHAGPATVALAEAKAFL
ncbi:MAG: acyl-CoA dehydrogenase family protein, partial [Myxococcales bacterium]|nr:acyl-CoA dehydrogenase family protein [Myxococcales bacterium]